MFYVPRPPEAPWGDYGHILVHGMTAHLPRAGDKLQLERAAPFLPPITFPGIGDILVTDHVRKALAAAEFVGIGFRPVASRVAALGQGERRAQDVSADRRAGGLHPSQTSLGRVVTGDGSPLGAGSDHGCGDTVTARLGGSREASTRGPVSPSSARGFIRLRSAAEVARHQLSGLGLFRAGEGAHRGLRGGRDRAFAGRVAVEKVRALGAERRHLRCAHVVRRPALIARLRRAHRTDHEAGRCRPAETSNPSISSRSSQPYVGAGCTASSRRLRSASAVSYAWRAARRFCLCSLLAPTRGLERVDFFERVEPAACSARSATNSLSSRGLRQRRRLAW